jgi:hypothetical protein
LGDGNFSFSLSLLNNLQLFRIENTKVVATSFDSYDEVRSKYSNANCIINELQKFSNVSVMFDVDACNLQNVFISGEKFENIIFNFPHLGIEDCCKHSSFLAHIFHRYLTYKVFIIHKPKL